jgi:hypothetical protein
MTEERSTHRPDRRTRRPHRGFARQRDRRRDRLVLRRPMAGKIRRSVERVCGRERRASVAWTGCRMAPVEGNRALPEQRVLQAAAARFRVSARISDRTRKVMRDIILAGPAILGVLSGNAMAGPPYISDDPEPTDYHHYEIYLFTSGMNARDGTSGAFGVDFNYGGMPDLQLTAVAPVAYNSPAVGSAVAGLGNVELAAKYRFLHQSEIGWDIAVFPRVFLPSGSVRVGESHASLFMPLWLEKDWGSWSAFGGGGCALNRGSGSQDFARQVGCSLGRSFPVCNSARKSCIRRRTRLEAEPPLGSASGSATTSATIFICWATRGPGCKTPQIPRVTLGMRRSYLRSSWF